MVHRNRFRFCPSGPARMGRVCSSACVCGGRPRNGFSRARSFSSRRTPAKGTRTGYATRDHPPDHPPDRPPNRLPVQSCDGPTDRLIDRTAERPNERKTDKRTEQKSNHTTYKQDINYIRTYMHKCPPRSNTTTGTCGGTICLSSCGTRLPR